MRLIVKEWKCTSGGEAIPHECPLVSRPIPIVSFLHFNKCEKSKSKVLNDVISTNHFFHRDLEGGDFTQLLGDGLVEICWYLPSGKQNDVFFRCSCISQPPWRCSEASTASCLLESDIFHVLTAQGR